MASCACRLDAAHDGLEAMVGRAEAIERRGDPVEVLVAHAEERVLVYGGEEAERPVDVPLRDRPGVRRPQVGELGVEPMHPAGLLGAAQGRLGLLGELDEVVAVSRVRRAALPRVEPIERDVAQRLEHPEAGRVVGSDRDEQ